MEKTEIQKIMPINVKTKNVSIMAKKNDKVNDIKKHEKKYGETTKKIIKPKIQEISKNKHKVNEKKAKDNYILTNEQIKELEKKINTIKNNMENEIKIPINEIFGINMKPKEK